MPAEPAGSTAGRSRAAPASGRLGPGHLVRRRGEGRPPSDDPTTFGVGNGAIDASVSSSTAGGTAFAAPTLVSSQSSDPAVSAQNDLQRQFWGDHNTPVSDGPTAWFTSTGSRTGEGGPAVDEYQELLDVSIVTS